MRATAARALGAALLVVLGCSGRSDQTTDVDAGAATSAVAPATSSLETAVKLARPAHGLAESLRPSASGLQRVNERYLSEGARIGNDASLMDARLPLFADESVRVGPGHIAKWSATLAPVDAEHVAAREDSGRLVYEKAWTATDVIVTSERRGVEWLLLVDSDAAPTTFKWKLALGSDLKVAAPNDDGSIYLVDGRGDAAIHLQPAFALDSKGVRRDVQQIIADGELTVSLDRKGLAYPILIDPSLSIPVWAKVATTGLGTGRNSATGVFLGAGGANRVLSIGGLATSGGFLNQVLAWNGTAWSPFTTMPAAVHSASAALVSGGKAYTFGGCLTADCKTNDNRSFVFDAVGVANFCGIGPNPACGSTLLMFGGRIWNSVAARFEPQNDTWIIDTASGTKTFTNITATGGPRGRYGAAMAGQTTGSYAVLFGGAGSGNIELWNDTWMFTKTGATSGTWTCVCSCSAAGTPVPPCPGEPSQRMNANMVYDEARGKFVLFGGWTQFGDGFGYSKSTYEFDPVKKTWTMLCAEGGPAECPIQQMHAGAGAYDPVRKRVVIAGGENYVTNYSNDTWEMLVRGGTCSSNTQCHEGYCVESTCCSVSSCPICKTCASETNPGTCTNVDILKADPLGRCDACDGAGNCKRANGQACTAGTECASGNCVESTCCAVSACGTNLTCANSQGKCLKKLGLLCSAKSECSSNECTDGTCCNVAACPSGSRCDFGTSGTCKKVNGQTCTLASECGSGYCVDGYCCNSACTDQCAACDVAPGSCAPVTGAPHGTRTACSGAGSCKATCTGTDAIACHYPGSTLTCGTASCASGSATLVGTCNGSGSCDQPMASCGVYACGTSACKSSCAADADCASGYYCAAPACVAKILDGNACSAGNQCRSGNCVDSVCCGSASCASGSTCNSTTRPGVCTKNNGQACTTASECGSGFCVDGFCCNSACTGQCQACNVVAGSCSNVIGSPVGGRTACTGGSGTCAARCDGISPSACVYPSASTSCGTPSCTGGVETSVSTCDGAGTCKPSSKSCGAYLCDTNACKTSCTASSDCTTGYYCKSGACAVKEPDGTACLATNPTACASGNCVDGVCCSVSACSGGAKCNTPGSAGTCAKPNGIACSTSAECGSGFCVDGVCCDTACSSQCAACDVSGKVGTCSAVAGAPHGTRTTCSGSGTGTTCGPTCDGTDTSKCNYPTGTKACGANTCVSGVETHTSVCNGSGACSDVAKTCGSYACSTTACKSTCTANTDCAAGNYCKIPTGGTIGSCLPIEGLGTACTSALTCTSGFCTDGVCCAVGSCGTGKSCSAGTSKGTCASLNGTACVANAECASGYCVDGVCCDGKCDGSCEACNSSGSIGKCVPIVGNPLTGHPPCSGTSSDPACGLSCDGTDGKVCKYAATTKSCGAPSCTGGIEKQVSTCDGAGTCKPASKTCGLYACGPTSCLASCTKNEDCASGNYCTSGVCKPVEGLGKACIDSSNCDSGFCTDSVCCEKASCGTGASCGGAGKCLKTNGSVCVDGPECASGSCVDGVCCDKACNGQCEACDVAGREGTCTLVVGDPHGGRTKCDSLEANDCKKAQCDGKVADKCNGFKNGATIDCGSASCTIDKRYQAIGKCDGAGGCAMPDPKNCTPFACDAAASNGCKSTCAADADCADGFTCDGGACVQGAKCSEDGTKSIDKTGGEKLCTPYKCGSDGKCATSCASSADCATGTVCDTNVKACVVYTVDSGGDDGGCAMGSSSRGSGAWLLIALGFLVSRVRARSAAPRARASSRWS